MDQLKPVLNCDQIVELQMQVRQVAVEASIYDYVLDIVDVTRRPPRLVRPGAVLAASLLELIPGMETE